MVEGTRRKRVLPTEYGSFRPDMLDFFVQEILPSCKSLLDPMAGTAPLAPYVEKMGLQGTFADISPVHFYVNQAKSYRACRTFMRLEESRKGTVTSTVIACMNGLRKKRLVVSKEWIAEDVLEGLVTAWECASDHDRSLAVLLKAVIVLCVRPYSCATHSRSNPTWLKQGGVSTGDSLPSVVNASVGRLNAYYNTHYAGVRQAKGKCRFICADVSRLTPKGKVDAVITSPPYGNRLEPEAMYGPEFFFLRHVGHALSSNDVLGTTRVRGYSAPPEDVELVERASPKTWGFLRQVEALGRAREADYYYRYHTRYYASLFKALKAVCGHVRKGGKIYLAVQDNIHRGELNTMGVFLCDFFRHQGWRASITFERLRSHLGRRNISREHPVVIRQHREQVVEACR